MSTHNDIEMRYDRLEARIALVQGRKCDKYDYLISVFCGCIAGIVDSIFVGAAGESILGRWTDAGADKVIKKLARLSGWKPDSAKSETIGNAINFFERRYPVNYDQQYGQAVGNILDMRAQNHHIKSLAHAPDIFGMVFSVMDQLTGSSHFLDNGRLIVFDTQTSMLKGYGNPVAMVFAGVCNWFWHCISDFAGSSNRTDNLSNRGSGIPIPFFELLQLCDFGEIKAAPSEEAMGLADFSVKLFESGYDARFGITMAFPMLICDLMIRFLWGIKQRFYHKKHWKECIPNDRHAELRVMLIVGNGTLCVIDGVDAAIRSGGNAISFFLHFNIVAWFKLSIRVLKEIQMRYDFSYEDLQIQFEYLNHQMQIYLERLKSIDYEDYRKQMIALGEIAVLIGLSEEDASERMGEYIEARHIETDFQDYDRFCECMLDPNKTIKW